MQNIKQVWYFKKTASWFLIKQREARSCIKIHEVWLPVFGFDIVQNVKPQGLIPAGSCLLREVSNPREELVVVVLLLSADGRLPAISSIGQVKDADPEKVRGEPTYIYMRTKWKYGSVSIDTRIKKQNSKSLVASLWTYRSREARYHCTDNDPVILASQTA